MAMAMPWGGRNRNARRGRNRAGMGCRKGTTGELGPGAYPKLFCPRCRREPSRAITLDRRKVSRGHWRHGGGRWWNLWGRGRRKRF
eukprot:351007-Rhodomonas_salina.1